MGQRCPSFLPVLGASGTVRSPSWQPPADVYRTARGWLVKFDLAGVCPGDIQLQACGRLLRISGERRDLRLEEGQYSYSMEISYNRFERALELPCDVESFRVTTEYRDGMLLVRLEGACP